MRLTKKEALDLSIELWEWLAETGKQKDEWSNWEKHGGTENDCFLCEYAVHHPSKGGLCNCPLADDEHSGCYDTAFGDWVLSHNHEDRKKYARGFLTQLKGIRDDNKTK